MAEVSKEQATALIDEWWTNRNRRDAKARLVQVITKALEAAFDEGTQAGRVFDLLNRIQREVEDAS